MRAMVIYDSAYGNTEKIARAIGQALSPAEEVTVLHVREAKPKQLAGLDLLIVGSPTHGGWFTEGIKALLEGSLVLQDVNVAAFDTRTATIWNRILPFGYAAPRIARSLERNGGHLLAPPEGFVVLGMEGPLKKGELERAADWAKGMAG
jgi:flavodoxin I